MRFVAFATDYDETLADEGVATERTQAALEKVRASGRRLLLVTGRELPDLRKVFPRVGELFDAVVAENGAVLWLPKTKEELLLAEPPPPTLYQALQKRGCKPLSAGKVIVSTREPHEKEVLEEIRDQALPLQVIFNKGAVMVLPTGVSKGTGLKAALLALGLSPRNCVACGDAENDHTFLAESELGVAVQNALPNLKERADAVTKHPAGRGVVELLEALLLDDLEVVAAGSTRRWVRLGHDEEGREVKLPPSGDRLLFAGPSGAGKSTAAKGFLERLIENGYQCCILDPEGDYDEFPGTLRLGDGQRPPTIDEVMSALEQPDQQVVVNLLGVKLADRPAFFAALLPRIQELRGRTGRPHWVVIDEAHHLVPASWTPAPVTLSKRLEGVMMVTMVPADVQADLLRDVDQIVTVGDKAQSTITNFCKAVGIPAPTGKVGPVEQGYVLLWRRGQPAPQRVKIEAAKADHRRHVRKYAQGELAPDRSFWFRGPEGKMNLRAQNLTLFSQMAAGVDDETWLHHLGKGDYSTWFRDFVKDEELAEQAEIVEQDDDLDAQESRQKILKEIDRRYTLGSGAQAG